MPPYPLVAVCPVLKYPEILGAYDLVFRLLYYL